MIYDIRITAAQLQESAAWVEGGEGMADVELLADDRMLIVSQGDDRIAFDTNGLVGSEEYQRLMPLDRRALASDFVADVDGRDARFTRTDDGHEPVADEAPEPEPVERPAATMDFEPWELDRLAAIVAGRARVGEADSWVAQRVLDKQVRNRLGKA